MAVVSPLYLSYLCVCELDCCRVSTSLHMEVSAAL